MGTSNKFNRPIFEKDGQTFLPGAIFVGVDFTNADLSGAEFRGPAAYKTQAELLAILSQATLCKTTLPDGTKSNRDCK